MGAALCCRSCARRSGPPREGNDATRARCYVRPDAPDQSGGDPLGQQLGLRPTTPWCPGRKPPVLLARGPLSPRRRQTTTCVLLLFCVAAGGLVAHLAMPSVFVSTRTQTTRLQYVLRALWTSEERPTVLAFGNSVGMGGIDARMLSDLLPPPRPVAWNVASPGATLIRTRLLLQEVPAETETVIVGVSTAELASETHTIPSSVYTALLMYGLRPTAETLAECAGAAPDSVVRLFETPPWRVPFEARWVVRSVIDEGARRAL